MALSGQLRAAAAIQQVLDGDSLSGASKAYMVPKTTLCHRIFGILTREAYNEFI